MFEPGAYYVLKYAQLPVLLLHRLQTRNDEFRVYWRVQTVIPDDRGKLTVDQHDLEPTPLCEMQVLAFMAKRG